MYKFINIIEIVRGNLIKFPVQEKKHEKDIWE